jgi:two-component system phosphate regulon sensor histidine kinase PhoR
VDPLAIGFVALLVGLAAASLAAMSRARRLDEIRGIAGEHHDEESAASAVRRLRDRAAAAEWEAARHRRDIAALADVVSVGIVRLDDELRVDFANEAAHLFLDRATGSMLGRSAIEAFVDDRIELIAVEARDRGSSSGEILLREIEGRALAVRARRSPSRGVWVVLDDVSELRRLQQIRAEFIDNLSHEIRTPLTNLSLLAETLSREADAVGDALPSRMRERIGKIEVETGHLIQMVNELLDLTRIESGTSFVPLDEVDVGRIAAAEVERLHLFAERQGVRLTLDLPPGGVPPVRGDDQRLGQVLVNLLHNAVKFSPDGGDVTVRVRTVDSNVVVTVEDEGIGIARAHRKRIFERFYKVDRARSRGGGTGLGLSISRHIVEQHGGRIWVESEEGRGSRFSFELAVAVPRPVTAEEPPGLVTTPPG